MSLKSLLATVVAVSIAIQLGAISSTETEQLALMSRCDFHHWRESPPSTFWIGILSILLVLDVAVGSWRSP